MQPHHINIIPTNTNDKTKRNVTNNIDNNINKPNIVPQPRSHGSTTQACAACKYQRRKCTSDCVLAPYFPHDRQRQFLNAHRLFGVSNIVKIVKHLQPPAKDHAMRTIIFQSDARAADPVGGCYRIIRDLEQRISLAKAELEIVLHHLALCRASSATRQPVSAEGRESTISWDQLESYNEKWRGQFGAADDVNSWGCLHGNVSGHVQQGESTSSSLPNHVSKVSLEEGNDGINNGNHDQLSSDDHDVKGGV